MAEVTELLGRWREGQSGAGEELFGLVYRELRLTAAALMRREEAGHTLQPSALVNEAYLRLMAQKQGFQNRRHFCGVAGQLMRNVLIDHAREQQALKRGAGQKLLPLDTGTEQGGEAAGMEVDLLDLEEALKRLERVLPQHARLVEYRYFGGLTVEEAAMLMQISTTTAKRNWAFAKAWLYRELTGGREREGLSSQR
jgi:RNA polymerase sigma-70 factor (ECF subfamily)